MMPTATDEVLSPSESGVTVRMYNPGFGDCLLLAFRAEDDTARYVLIDSGVRNPGRQAKMKLIAEDIAKATANHIHAVAITHEHTDHTLGFQYAQNEFRGVAIDDLWLPWTEDPTNGTANRIRKAQKAKRRTLAAAIETLAAAKNPLAESLRAVAHSDLPEVVLDAEATMAPLDFLRNQSARKLECPKDYLNPEDVLTLPGVENVKIYVLGPPENETMLRIDELEEELYPKMAAMSIGGAFGIAALASSAKGPSKDDKALFKKSQPFDESYSLSKDKARKPGSCRGFFLAHYGFSDRDPDPWRRIENDWLEAAMELLTKYKEMANNLSLVLAIELTDTDPRKVLLFVGDAQVGNWLSWEKLRWPIEGSDDKKMKAADLLRRTVLYKVGHHGSHNGTLKEKGLELMESADLVAMIPVDEDWARGLKPYPWNHPAPKLLARLQEKTRGRVLRSDRIPSAEHQWKKPEQLGASEWESFCSKVKWDESGNELWIQYTISG